MFHFWGAQNAVSFQSGMKTNSEMSKFPPKKKSCAPACSVCRVCFSSVRAAGWLLRARRLMHPNPREPLQDWGS